MVNKHNLFLRFRIEYFAPSEKKRKQKNHLKILINGRFYPKAQNSSETFQLNVKVIYFLFNKTTSLVLKGVIQPSDNKKNGQDLYFKSIREHENKE